MTDLADRIRACRLCPLADQQEEGRTPVPPYIGAKYGTGGIAVMCDAPSFYASKDGAPLSGREGALFNKLAARAGMERSYFLLTHTVRCRPANNRLQDYPEAINACSSWVQEEFNLYDPSIVVLMGRTAMRPVFGADALVTTTRGNFASMPPKHPWGPRLYIATYHPAAALRAGGEESTVAQYIVQDLSAAMQAWRALKWTAA